MTDTYKKTIFEKHFNNVEEVFEDEKFGDILFKSKESISRIGIPPKGMRFKRTGVDFLIENEMLTNRRLIDEYRLIVDKKSNLSSCVRMSIVRIINNAIQKTIMSYSKVIESEVEHE